MVWYIFKLATISEDSLHIIRLKNKIVSWEYNETARIFKFCVQYPNDKKQKKIKKTLRRLSSRLNLGIIKVVDGRKEKIYATTNAVSRLGKTTGEKLIQFSENISPDNIEQIKKHCAHLLKLIDVFEENPIAEQK